VGTGKALRLNSGGALRPVVPGRPSTDSSTDDNEERRDGEKSALQLLRCRAVLDEAPNDVVAVDQIGKKSGSYDENCAARHALWSDRCVPFT